MYCIRVFFTPCLLLFLILLQVQADEFDDFIEFEESYGELTSIASGFDVPVDRAPGVITVITQSDIRNSSATHLDHLLERVPGLHISRDSFLYKPIYSFRSLHSEGNSNVNAQVLFLVNGQSFKSVYSGGRALISDYIPLHAISYIEIIRGPASALYGADAFSGVINIVTKNYDSTFDHVGGSVSSFNAKEVWFQKSGIIENWKMAFHLGVNQSDGDDSIINRDVMTYFDEIFDNNASRAPGSVNRHRKGLDAHLSAEKGKWEVHTTYFSRQDLGLGLGFGLGLDPLGHQDEEHFLFNVAVKDYKVSDVVRSTTRYEYSRSKQSGEYFIFPENSQVNLDRIFFFPDGLKRRSGYQEDTHKIKHQWHIEAFENHTPVIRLGVRYQTLSNINDQRNFDDHYNIYDQLVDFSGDETHAFILEHERRSEFFLFQDTYHMAHDWDVIAGFRYDHYSDVDNFLSPRLGFVWMADYNLTLKWLYGRSFRTPSFAELYSINDSSYVGNPDIDPESIDTYEVAIHWQPSSKLNLDFNVYYFQLHNALSTVADDLSGLIYTSNRFEEYEGVGFEVEGRYRLSSAFSLLSNFSVSRLIGEHGEHNELSPGYQWFFASRWAISQEYSFSTEIHSFDHHHRESSVDRTPIKQRTVVDMALNFLPMGSQAWKSKLVMNNVFDEEVKEPGGSLLQEDLPLPGRTWLLKVEYYF